MAIKQITIFGSTGLIGGHALEFLLKDNEFKKINLVSRRPTFIKNKKIEEYIIDFNNYSEIKRSIQNSEIVISSIGTTQSGVKGDKNEYRKIDYGITLNIAKACKESDVKKFIFVSTIGADINSKNFYLSLKGEIEESVLNFNINSVHIMRPSLLLGKRKERRFGEKVAQNLMPLISSLLPNKYRPIDSILVAKKIINTSKSKTLGNKIYNYNEIK
tara:strand:+ start:51 stop:698 length:648 start_codon:yes stop_codon:yes gene_type:complete